MTIIILLTEFWPSQESNLGPPVLKSATLPTELWGLVEFIFNGVESIVGKGENTDYQVGQNHLKSVFTFSLENCTSLLSVNPFPNTPF